MVTFYLLLQFDTKGKINAFLKLIHRKKMSAFALQFSTRFIQ